MGHDKPLVAQLSGSRSRVNLEARGPSVNVIFCVVPELDRCTVVITRKPMLL